MTPWRFGDPAVLQQDLKDAGFSVVTCTPFSHPMKFAWAHLLTFLLGPHGQLRPMLTKLKSDGRSDVNEEAEEVRFPWSQSLASHSLLLDLQCSLLLISHLAVGSMDTFITAVNDFMTK